MSLYQRWVVPKLIDFAMRQRPVQRYRRKLVPQARGRVLEVGVGSGMNLAHYASGVSEVVGIDPSERLLDMARRRAAAAGVQVSLRLGSASAMDVEDASFDTVVMTWTLCSIAEPLAALREMRRVLKPGGNLLFVEHGLAADENVARWQRRLTPAWRRLAGGCHLDRKVDDLVRAAGFELPQIRTEYAEGPRVMTFMYEGRAVPAS
jgi:ubiquinone/menaquinone biosynthesis C-methylase UbiE